jgi:hypothetical protein
MFSVGRDVHVCAGQHVDWSVSFKSQPGPTRKQYHPLMLILIVCYIETLSFGPGVASGAEGRSGGDLFEDETGGRGG